MGASRRCLLWAALIGLGLGQAGAFAQNLLDLERRAEHGDAVRAMVMPALTDVSECPASLSRVRQIDLEDVLGREPVHIDTIDRL